MAHQHHNVCGSKKGATGQAWRGECVGPPCLESGVSTTTMSQSELLPDFLSVLCHPMMSSRSEAWGPNKWQKFYDREKTNSTSFTVQKLNEKKLKGTGLWIRSRLDQLSENLKNNSRKNTGKLLIIVILSTKRIQKIN